MPRFRARTGTDTEPLGVAHLVFAPGSRPRARRSCRETHGAIASIPLRHGHADNRSFLMPRPPSVEEARRIARASGRGATVRCYRAPDASLLRQPVFIVSAPRTGSTLLFEMLGQSPQLWTAGGESHEILEHGRSVLGPRGNTLDAGDAGEPVRRTVRAAFTSVRDQRGRLLMGATAGAPPAPLRLLEKTPRMPCAFLFSRRSFPAPSSSISTVNPAPTSPASSKAGGRAAAS